MKHGLSLFHVALSRGTLSHPAVREHPATYLRMSNQTWTSCKLTSLTYPSPSMVTSMNYTLHLDLDFLAERMHTVALSAGLHLLQET